MGYDFDMSAEDIKVFLDEAEEQLQVMESGILRLEKEAENPEHLQEIFRAAHTLKGSSATLGHKKMAEVTHSMENVLDKLRKGKLKISTVIVDTLFACLDVLMLFKEEITTGVDSGLQILGILNRLAAIDSSPEAKAVPTPSSLPPAMNKRVGESMQPLTETEQLQMSAAHSRGLTVIWTVVRLHRNAAMPAVRAFQLLLAVEEMGEMIRSCPTQAEVEEDRISEEIQVLFATEHQVSAVRATLAALPEITLTEVVPLYGGPPVPAVGEIQASLAAAASVGAEVSVEAEASQDAEASAQVESSAENVVDAALRDAAAVSSNVDRGENAGGSLDSAIATAAARTGKSASRTVRVDVDILDNLMSLVGELVIDRTRLAQVLTRLELERDGDETVQIMASAVAHIGRMTTDLQDEIQRARMLPVDNLFRKFPRMVREIASRASKEIEFVVLGAETELDRSVIEEIGDPLMHLLRNAVDHGVEPTGERLKAGKPVRGAVTLQAYHEENHIVISVQDDGRGIDPKKIRESAIRKGMLTDEAAQRMQPADFFNLVWAPGFSTADQVSDLSGRGVGLDVVHRNIEKLNGSVEIKTEIGRGTTFCVKLPLTLAIIRSLQVKVSDTTYCIPLSSVVETDRITIASIQTIRQREVIVKRGEVIPLLRLEDGCEQEGALDQAQAEFFVVIVSVMGKQFGIVVDTLVGEGDVVIKPLGKYIGDVPGVSGATIMGDGDVAIILDISSLINIIRVELDRGGSGSR